MKQRIKKVILFIALMSSICTIFATTAQENSYLIQLFNQLTAMKALVLAAEKAQPRNQRVTFHYTAWNDNEGHRHNGLLEDINAIQSGIAEKLNGIASEPRTIQPLNGDYLDSRNKAP